MSSIQHALAEMQGIAQWVNFVYVQRGEKRTKPPINPHIDPRRPLHERLAQVNDPTTWGTYQQALQRYRSAARTFGYQGIGFMFSSSDPYTGLDVDACRNPQTGEIAEWVLRIVRDLNSYTEVSPSGTGLHIIVRANLIEVSRTLGRTSLRHRANSIEVYDRGRYFTITGTHLSGTPETIEGRQEELVALYLTFFPEETVQKTHTPLSTPPQQTLSDQDILDGMARSKNGYIFRALWSGNPSQYTDQNGRVDESRADLVLLSMLAYWTGRDAGSMERLFKQSGLYRNRPWRWNQPARSGETYGQSSIRIAIERCHSVYDPTWKPAASSRRTQQKKNEQEHGPPSSRSSTATRYAVSSLSLLFPMRGAA